MPSQWFESDPQRAPDSDFESGVLEHWCAGNDGRLLDFRRTPVRIRAISCSTGLATVEIMALYGDRGNESSVSRSRSPVDCRCREPGVLTGSHGTQRHGPPEDHGEHACPQPRLRRSTEIEIVETTGLLVQDIPTEFFKQNLRVLKDLIAIPCIRTPSSSQR